MGMKESITDKMLRATSDKVALNKQALAWKKSFMEVNKALGPSGKKQKK